MEKEIIVSILATSAALFGGFFGWLKSQSKSKTDLAIKKEDIKHELYREEQEYLPKIMDSMAIQLSRMSERVDDYQDREERFLERVQSLEDDLNATKQELMQTKLDFSSCKFQLQDALARISKLENGH